VKTNEVAAAEGRHPWWRLLASVGPGLMFLAAMTGPGTLLSNAAAGANYGYNLIWALALSLLFRYVWVDTTARYVLVTGESLLQGYARIGQWLVWTVFGAAILVRHSTNLYTVLLMGDAAHTLLPLPVAQSAAIWTVVFTLLGFAMMFWGGYPALEHGCRILMVILVASMAVAAFYSHPKPLPILWGTLVPWIPQSQGVYSSILIITAMIGAQVGTLSNLSYAYFVGEKGWNGIAAIRKQRFDLLSGFGCRFILGALLQIAAAGTLLPLGIIPENASDLTRIFRTTIGATGGIIFGLGIWAMCFSNFVSGTSGYALILRDISRRYMPRLAGDGHRLQDPARQDPVYRWSVALLGLSPLYIVFTKAESVALALTVRSLVVVLIPILGAALLVLANRKELMRNYRNGWKSNFVMVLMLLVSLYLIGRNTVDLWRG
jgi:Mn2+/Fe2+ NRAMP family transporter